MTLTFTVEQYKFLEAVRMYAYKCHEARNQKYDDKPYSFHLDSVHDFGLKYIHLIPEQFRFIAIASLRMHDLIEDTGETFNNVKDFCLSKFESKAAGETIAEITFALTNEKGRTRKDRANAAYYKGIRETPLATFIKVCDRLANASHSKTTSSNMISAYRKENEHFKKELYKEELKEMFDELDEILKDK